MATPDPTKSFIIKHMNTDHQDSLSLYLQVYNNVSASTSKTAYLSDLTLSDLLITTSDNNGNNVTRYTVPLTPPMKSFSETRSRVVAMHHHCLTKLGLSDITITEYRPPRGTEAIGLAFCVFVYVLFSRRSNFVPGSMVYDRWLHLAPSASEFCYSIQPKLFYGLLGTHILEAVAFTALQRLRPHRVPFLSRLWFAWVVSTLFEGFVAWKRFDEMVKEKRAEREKSGKK